MKREELRNIFKNVALLSQLGLSIIMPILICIGICAFLTNRLSVGSWIYILGFVFGLGASFMTVYKFYLAETNKSKKEEKKTVSFNSHD